MRLCRPLAAQGPTDAPTKPLQVGELRAFRLAAFGCDEPRLISALGLGFVADDEGLPKRADSSGVSEVASGVAQRDCYLIDGEAEFVMGPPGQFLDRSRLPLRLGGLMGPLGSGWFRGRSGRLCSVLGLLRRLREPRLGLLTRVHGVLVRGELGRVFAFGIAPTTVAGVFEVDEFREAGPERRGGAGGWTGPLGRVREAAGRGSGSAGRSGAGGPRPGRDCSCTGSEGRAPPGLRSPRDR